MADFILENEIEADVDLDGNATKTRRWIFRNTSNGDLDLGRFSVWFETTDRHVQITSALDSLKRPLRCEPCLKPEGYCRVTCYFEKVIEAGATYSVEVVYKQPGYFMYLSDCKCWLVDEWFARTGVIDAGPYVQQDTERWSYVLHIADPRPRILGEVRNPFKVLHVETNPRKAVEETADGATIRWDMNLAPLERSEKLYILYHVRWRTGLLAPVGALGIAVAGAAVWSAIQALGGVGLP